MKHVSALKNEWRWVSFSEVCATTSGGTPSRGVSEYYRGDIPWVKSGELVDGLIYDTEEKISPAAIENSSAKIFPAGTLLIALYGATVGKLGVLKIDAATNQAVCAIFPSDQVNRDFLFYYLLKQRNHLIANRTGGAQPNISQEVVRDLKIYLPPLPEQQRIAAILDKADRLRRMRRYALDLGETYLQSVFLEMFGNFDTNPKKWEVVELQEVCRRITDGTHQPPEWSTGGIPFLFVSNVVDGELSFDTEKFISRETWLELNNRCPVERNDILFTIVGSYGNAALVRTERPFSFQRHIAHIKPDANKIHPEFLLGMLQSPGVRSQVDREARGVAQKTLNLRELQEIRIFKPGKAAQIRYVEIRRQAERLRGQQRESLRQAEMLFGALLEGSFQPHP